MEVVANGRIQLFQLHESFRAENEFFLLPLGFS